MAIRTKQPILHIPRSQMEVALEIAGVIGILLSAIVLIQSWPILPDSVPSHFGPSGKPDAWSGKETLLILPVVAIVLYIMLTLLCRFPHIYNYPWRITEQNARRQYQLARSLVCWLKTEIVWLFTFIDWKAVEVALGRAEGLGKAFLPVTLIIIFGTIGFYIVQAYQAR